MELYLHTPTTWLYDVLPEAVCYVTCTFGLGSAVRLAESAVRLAGSAVRLAGSAVRLAGSAVRLAGSAVRLAGIFR